MHQSIWRNTEELSGFAPLSGSVKTDVLVIGGGMCGILCAYFLQQAGVDCMVVEGSTIGSGMTENTTAKITSQHGLIYDKFIEEMGTERAAQYLWANEKALENFRRMDTHIDCDFQEKDAYVYSRRDRNMLEREVHAVNLLGFPAEFRETEALPFDTCGAVCFPNQAQFHPLKFIRKIAENLEIYEHTFVHKVEGKTAYTSTGEVHADKIIVATHFPFLNMRGGYFLKLYQHRSYVIALENTQDVGAMYIDEDKSGLSFRNYGNFLFIGGGSHRTGKQGGGWQMLRDFARDYYPKATEVYSWAAQDCMSLDGIPYIGNYSKNTPDLYVASGFNKWGMTGSMVSAMLLCDKIMGMDSQWGDVFSPDRRMVKSQLLANSLEATVNLLTPAVKRCPHMGCALKWNSREHTWDCPCHGSRFEESGILINNPAKKDAKIR